MSEQHINVKPESKEGDSIFDLYFAKIERLRLETPNLSYNYLQNALTIIERNLFDLNVNIKSSKLIFDRIDGIISEILHDWLPFLDLLSKETSFLMWLAYNFFGVSLLTEDWDVSEEDMESLANSLSPSYKLTLLKSEVTQQSDVADELLEIAEDYEKKLKKQVLKSNKLKVLQILKSINDRYREELPKVNEALFGLYHQCNRTAFVYSFDELNNETGIEQLREKSRGIILKELKEWYFTSSSLEIYYEWNLTISTKEKHPDANKFFGLISLFIGAIKLIDENNIDLNLTMWGSGSQWANFSIKFKSFFARKETKQLLGLAVRAGKAELFDKRIGQAEKVQAETKKVEKETENLLDKDKANEINRLSVELKHLEVLEKKVDINQKLEDLKAKKINNITQIVELLKTGFVAYQPEFQIEINDLLYLIKEKDEIMSYNSMDAIDGRGAVMPLDNKDSLSHSDLG